MCCVIVFPWHYNNLMKALFMVAIGQSIIFLPCGFFFLSLLPPCVGDADIIFLHCGFFFFFCLLFSSPNLSRRRLDVYHICTHGVALVNLRCKSETCCMGLAANTVHKKSSKIAIWAPSHAQFVGLYLRN